MKIFVNKPLENSKKLSEITKSIKKTENNHKNSFFDLGRNPLEIVHGPFKIDAIKLESLKSENGMNKEFFVPNVIRVIVTIAAPKAPQLNLTKVSKVSVNYVSNKQSLFR